MRGIRDSSANMDERWLSKLVGELVMAWGSPENNGTLITRSALLVYGRQVRINYGAVVPIRREGVGGCYWEENSP